MLLSSYPTLYSKEENIVDAKQVYKQCAQTPRDTTKISFPMQMSKGSSRNMNYGSSTDLMLGQKQRRSMKTQVATPHNKSMTRGKKGKS